MRALQVALDALGAQHAAVERELFPRLEADDFVVTHLELNAALLAAEAAVRLDELLRFVARGAAHLRRAMRPEGVDDVDLVDGNRGHWLDALRPGCALRQAEERTAAARADLLIVRGAGELVAEA